MRGPFDDDEFLVAAGGPLAVNLAVANEVVRPIAVMSVRTVMCGSAQAVELLLEHHSISSNRDPSADRVARPIGSRTDGTIAVTVVPSALSRG